MIFRFDDTNPVKEKDVFERSIISDLERIGIKWDVMTYTSDNFEKMLGFCEKLIKEGKAYTDNTNMETIRIERENRISSRCRDNCKF